MMRSTRRAAALSIQLLLAILYCSGSSLSAHGQENIYAKMRRVIAAAQHKNPRMAGLMTSPPMITVVSATNAPGGLNNIYSPNNRSGVLTAYGGRPLYTYQGGNKNTLYLNIQTNKIPNSPGFGTLNFRWEAMVDSSRFAVRVFGTGANVRFIFDGQYVDFIGLPVPVGDYFIVFDFSCAGGRVMRKVDIEASSYYFGFAGFYVARTEGVYRSPGSPLRVSFLGDSYFAGGGVTNPADGLPAVMGDLMGTPDEWSEGQGGTGFLQVGSFWPYRSHLSDLTENRPDFAIIGSASNDQFSSSPAQVTSEVKAVIAEIRKVPATSSIPLFFVGAWPNQYGVTATNTAMDKAVGQAVKEAQAAGDANVFWIPCVADPNGAWITGTGNTGNPKGDGNLDLYGATDGAHLNAAGWLFVAQHFVGKILEAIQNK